MEIGRPTSGTSLRSSASLKRSCAILMAVLLRSPPVARASRWSGESPSCFDWRVSMGDPIVSILLVTWKRIDLLEECVNGIAAARPAVPFELVIVNNGGSRTADRVEAIAPGARVVHARVNLGLPGGLRLARSVARGRYLATLQDDVVVQEGWLDRLVERMDADPWVGIVGSRVELPDGRQICGLYVLGGLSWLHPTADPTPTPVD